MQRKSSATAIETAAKQNEVAIAGLGAENERLRSEHLEGERRNRQDAYLKMLVALDRLDALATGFAARADLADAMAEDVRIAEA